VEILVGLALFGMITTLIAVAFMLAHRYTRVYHQLSTAERECNQCLASVGHLLRRGRSETLQAPPSSDACWFLSSAPPVTSPDQTTFNQTSGELEYHKWQAIYRRSDGQVLAAEMPLAAGAAVFQAAMLNPVPTDLAVFLPTRPQRVLARSIRRLVVRSDSSGLIHVDVEAQTTESGNPATRYLLSSSFPGQ